MPADISPSSNSEKRRQRAKEMLTKQLDASEGADNGSDADAGPEPDIFREATAGSAAQ